MLQLANLCLSLGMEHYLSSHAVTKWLGVQSKPSTNSHIAAKINFLTGAHIAPERTTLRLNPVHHEHADFSVESVHSDQVTNIMGPRYQFVWNKKKGYSRMQLWKESAHNTNTKRLVRLGV